MARSRETIAHATPATIRLLVAGKLAVDGSPLSAEELSRERRRVVKDARSIFDRGFELAAFVPLVP
jgi:hypothetical protein